MVVLASVVRQVGLNAFLRNQTEANDPPSPFLYHDFSNLTLMHIHLRKHELLTRSLRKMERTLDTVLRSISNPGMSAFASGMVSRSPSPSNQDQAAQTQALLDSPSPPPSVEATPSVYLPGSPKLHSLPDNDLNPLGLLAEASLANRRAQIINNPSSSGRMLANSLQPEDTKNVGVASDVYFKPGKSLLKFIIHLILIFVKRTYDYPAFAKALH